MIRYLASWLGISGLPVLLAFLQFTPASDISGPRLVRATVHSAVWEIQAKQNAEMEALKERIEVLQGRVALANQKLSNALAALESRSR
jgi:hypothetical protein